MLIKQPHRLIAIARTDNPEAGFFEHFRCAHADEKFVLDK
jgi:hypothetical protein